MRNHIERILSKVKLHINQDIYDKLISECGNVSGDITLAEQGLYIITLLENLLKLCGEEKVAEIMQSCGALANMLTGLSSEYTHRRQERAWGGELPVRAAMVFASARSEHK